MKYLVLSCIGLPWILGACARTQHTPVAAQACSRSALRVDGNQI
jgi:hypothetical protein